MPPRLTLHGRPRLVLASWMRDDHTAGTSVRHIARRYDVPRKTTADLIRLMGTHPAPHPAPATPSPPDIDPARIRAEYEAGARLRQLRDRYHLNEQRLRALITSAGGTIRPPGRPRINPDTAAAVAHDYTAGTLVPDIARRHGIHTSGVYKALAAAGVHPGRRPGPRPRT